MKKLILTVALAAAMAFSANAQIRVEAMGNFSWLTFEEGNITAKTNAEFGYGVRGLYEIPFKTADAGFDVGLGFMSTKSSRELTNATITLNSLQLPFHVYDKWDLGAVSLAIYAGFYGGYYLGGKTTFDASVAKLDTDPFAGDGGLQRFDFGSDDELLFTFADHFTLGVGFQYSFLNLCKTKSVDIGSDNLYISVGYAF